MRKFPATFREATAEITALIFWAVMPFIRAAKFTVSPHL